MGSFVAVMMGSASDVPVLEQTFAVLDTLQISFEKRILSAHRNPDGVADYVSDAESRGCQVFICAAGLAAHLAGAVAGRTLRPVIGVPVNAGPLQGVDALLSTVQMPPGIPVATVAIGAAGARNAAWLAGQILALGDTEVAERLVAAREAARVAAQQSDLDLS